MPGPVPVIAPAASPVAADAPNATSTPASPPSVARDAVVALSLANFLALHLWAGVLDPGGSWFRDEPLPWTVYVATVVAVALPALGGLPLARLRFRGPGWARAVEVLFAAALALAVWGTRRELADATGAADATMERVLAPIAGAVVLLGTVGRARWRERFRRVATGGLLVLSPFVAVTYGQAAHAAWRSASGRDALVARPPAARLPSRHGPRVVVVLMDELDQLIAFDERPAGLALPALDALRAEGYQATRAVPPGNLTDTCVPSLLTGRRVVAATDAGASDRRLVFAGGESARFSEVPTIFTRARERGQNAAAAGFFLPYCRVVGDDLAACTARSYWGELQGARLGEALTHQLVALVEIVPHAGKLTHRLVGEPRLERLARRHVETWRVLSEAGEAAALDSDVDLAWLHWSLPHPPEIGDARTGRVVGHGVGTYAGNLAVADAALGALVEKLRARGLWERTALVILADHPKRKGRKLQPLPSPRLAPGEPRPVPLIVRIPGGGPGVVEEGRNPTVVLAPLVDALLQGRLQRHAELPAWLAAHAPP